MVVFTRLMRLKARTLHIVIPEKEVFWALRYKTSASALAASTNRSTTWLSVSTCLAFSGRPSKKSAIGPSSPGAVVGCHGCIDGRPQGHDRFGELLRLVFPDRFLPKSSKSRRNVGNWPCKPLGMGRTAERASEGRFWGALFDLFRSQTDWYAAPVAAQSVAWRGKTATGSVPY